MTKPFIKWAGGKTQLIPEIQTALERVFVEDRSLIYVEPFVGGGAVLFHVLDTFPNIQKVIINDINPDLIAAYKTIVSDLERLIAALGELEARYISLKDFETKKAFYLKKRKEFNKLKGSKSSCAIARTVLFIFLNKTCFNGLYRVNKKGFFNVPFGGHLKPNLSDRANFLAIRDRLRHAEILQGDFIQTLSYLNKNTVFYIDPPYKPLDATSSFTSYTPENFSDGDQLRVKDFCDRVHLGGGQFILSNSDVKNGDGDTPFFENLYRDRHYSIRTVKAKRSINCKGTKRGFISELLITNF
ncbi:MAG: Dam family site-specific DNA-(adenine-N6)-methyltransferase [Cyanobacteriota bacterium]|nr:Dam family site-specific DNA-(adenine-N6)-methyltransferase [Cyanobacteriota bacterium]